MKRVLLLGPLLLVGLAGCSEEPTDDPTVVTTDTQSATSQAQVALPAAPTPSVDGPCPYLEESYVEETNGQRVSKVQTSDEDPPSCFFYRPDGGVQLTVRVYSGDAAVAKGLVDEAAPVATANPATLDGGWNGGAQPTEEGAVFAVAKDKSAILVTTNQEQTIKAKQIAQEAVTALGL